jgi:hypothetical protein
MLANNLLNIDDMDKGSKALKLEAPKLGLKEGDDKIVEYKYWNIKMEKALSSQELFIYCEHDLEINK